MGIGMYRTYKFWLSIIYGIGSDFTVYGRENLVEQGPLIVASNHASYLDPLMLGLTFDRPLCFMARRTLFDNPFFGWIIRNVFAFPLDRKGDVRSALKNFCKKLDERLAVVIFPEGTRTHDGRLRPFESAVGMLAVRRNAPIQPLYIMGSFQCWPRGRKRPRFAPVRIYVAPAIYPKTDIARNEKRTEQERIHKEYVQALQMLEDRAWAEYPKQYLTSQSTAKDTE